MSDKKPRQCKVTIMGESFMIMTTETEEHVQRAATLIDVTMQEIAAKSTSVDEKKVAVLAALRVASKFLLLEDNFNKDKEKEKHLIAVIEQAL